MSQGPIPQYTFNSGVAPQSDGQHPTYYQPPQPQKQQNQMMDQNVIKTFETLPVEAQQMLKSINPITFQEAQAIINRIADQVLSEPPMPASQNQVQPVQPPVINTPIDYVNNYNGIM